MNIANKITLSRIVLTFAFAVLASFDNKTCHVIAFFVGFIAASSDWVDGYIARKYDLITDFGKLMDPLADKIFITVVFIIFVQYNIVPAYIVIIILVREFAVTGLRLIAAQKGKVIAAAMGGKVKTVVQFLYLALAGLVWAFFADKMPEILFYSLEAFKYATVVITVYTGYEYFTKNKELYLESV